MKPETRLFVFVAAMLLVQFGIVLKCADVEKEVVKKIATTCEVAK